MSDHVIHWLRITSDQFSIVAATFFPFVLLQSFASRPQLMNLIVQVFKANITVRLEMLTLFHDQRRPASEIICGKGYGY
jgi:hypothetical protein